MRRVLPIVAVAAAISLAPSAGATDGPSFAAVTTAERRATQPLSETVLAAYRSGTLAALCDLFSPAEIRRVHGSLPRCRRTLAGSRHPCTNRCSYKVFGVFGAYLTERDKALRRKTIAWLYVVRGHPGFEGRSELEIRLRKDRGHWVLPGNPVEAGSGR